MNPYRAQETIHYIPCRKIYCSPTEQMVKTTQIVGCILEGLIVKG